MVRILQIIIIYLGAVLGKNQRGPLQLREHEDGPEKEQASLEGAHREGIPRYTKWSTLMFIIKALSHKKNLSPNLKSICIFSFQYF